MSDLYVSGGYKAMHATWHSEDSEWKAGKIAHILRKNSIQPERVLEIGCGAGGVLHHLAKCKGLEESRFYGYDIAQDAINLAKKHETEHVAFCCGDAFEDPQTYDLAIVIDVLEHVPNYIGFLENCRSKARYKIYHIPLDIHVSSVTRASLMTARELLGHLHYFTAETALASLIDTGHTVHDYFYTDGAIALFHNNPNIKQAIANIPRKLTSLLSEKVSARLFGGFSLLVLTT